MLCIMCFRLLSMSIAEAILKFFNHDGETTLQTGIFMHCFLIVKWALLEKPINKPNNYLSLPSVNICKNMEAT
jgi:hypothetical protein